MYSYRKIVLFVLIPVVMALFPSVVQADDHSMLETGKRHFSTKQYYYATTWLERMLTSYPTSGERREALILIIRAYALSDRSAKAAHYLTILRKEFPDAAQTLEVEFPKRMETETATMVATVTAKSATEVTPTSKKMQLYSSVQAVQPFASTVLNTKKTAPDHVKTELLSKRNIDSKPAVHASDTIPKKSANSSALIPSTTSMSPVSQTTVVPMLADTHTTTAKSSTGVTSSTIENKMHNHKRIGYVISTGEVDNRSALDSLIKQLKTAGFIPTVRKANKSMEVFRLVTGCYKSRESALKKHSDLVRNVKEAFIVFDNKQFCVVAGSYKSHKIALEEQATLEKNSINIQVVPVQIPVTTWKIVAGHYKDSSSAATALQLLAKQGIVGVVVPDDM